MVIVVHEGRVGVSDVDNLERFHVEAAESMSLAVLDKALARSGSGQRTGSGQVAIDVSWVLRQVQDAVDGGWEQRFHRMLAYAGTKGWTSEDGSNILAHLVRC